jgi:hypothetical protein
MCFKDQTYLTHAPEGAGEESSGAGEELIFVMTKSFLSSEVGNADSFSSVTLSWQCHR